uniref:GAG-pre-integrase domain-containing protein n=1 Tax=Rhynchosporium agropyri TaxID=914238 RepID=A0A1E1L9Q9_9HELO
MKLAITLNCKAGPLAHTTSKTTALDIWEALQAQYEGGGNILVYNAIQDYVKLQYNDFNSLEKFIIAFKLSIIKLETLIIAPPPAWHPIMFIAAVSEKWPIWAERQRSLLRVSSSNNADTTEKAKSGVTLVSLIEDITDEARLKKKEGESKTDKTDKKKTSSGKKKEKNNDSDDSSIFGAALLPYFPTITASTAIFSHHNKSRWLFDTGATEHISNNLSKFTSYTPRDDLQCMLTVNGPLRPTGIGSYTIKALKTDGTVRTLECYNTLYIPQSPVCLYSGSKLNKLGGYLRSSVLYTSKEKEICTIDEDLFIIEETSGAGYASLPGLSLPAAVEQATVDIELWHRRICHASFNVVRRTQSIVTSMKFTELKTSRTRLYAPYEKGRPIRKRVQSHKVAPRAEKGILVGFEGHNIYRYLVNGKVVRTSHLRFNEDGLVTEPHEEDAIIVPQTRGESIDNLSQNQDAEVTGTTPNTGITSQDEDSEVEIDSTEDAESTVTDEVPAPEVDIPEQVTIQKKRNRPPGSKNHVPEYIPRATRSSRNNPSPKATPEPNNSYSHAVSPLEEEIESTSQYRLAFHTAQEESPFLDDPTTLDQAIKRAD